MRTLRLQPDGDSEDRIVVDVAPGAAPAWVFLHGMTSTRQSSKSEDLLARATRAGLGFARLDFRGHGESDGDLRTLRFSQLVEDVAAVLAEVGPSVLIGSSMGGLAAAWAAAMHPENIRALVLMSPAFGFLSEMAKHRGSFDLRRSDEETVAIAEDTLRDAERFDEATLPAKLRLPVMVAHGSADGTVPATQSERFCEGIGHARKELWIIDGGSHSLGEVRGEVFDRMEAFLRRHDLLASVD